MLIDALTRALRESEALSAVYSKLDAGSDAALGIAERMGFQTHDAEGYIGCPANTPLRTSRARSRRT